MASYTTNLNLKKPAGSENVSIGDINNNMELIDSAYGTLNSNITNSTITSPTSNGLTCSYVVRSGFCYVHLYGSPTTTENITFTVPKALLGEYLTCEQWGNTANIIQVFIDQNTTTLIIRNHTQNNMNVSFMYPVA